MSDKLMVKVSCGYSEVASIENNTVAAQVLLLIEQASMPSSASDLASIIQKERERCSKDVKDVEERVNYWVGVAGRNEKRMQEAEAKAKELTAQLDRLRDLLPKQPEVKP